MIEEMIVEAIEEVIEEVIEDTAETVKNEDLNVEEATLEKKEEMIVTVVSDVYCFTSATQNN